MDPILYPCSSEANLRFYLQKLSEFGEFDQHVITYVEDCLKHRIVKRPSKWSYGEQGKDFVAVENEVEREYCAYVIEEGNLSSNLKGQYGILKQMNDAMFIDLEEKEFNKKRRTVVIAYNGYDNYRGASKEFEVTKNEIEDVARERGILLRNIERWDLSTFAKKLFPHCEELLAKEKFRNKLNQMIQSLDIASSLRFSYSNLKIDEQNPASKTEEVLVRLNKDVIKMEDKYGPLKKLLNYRNNNDK